MITKTLTVLSALLLSSMNLEGEQPDFAKDLAIEVDKVEPLGKEVSAEILDKVGELVGKPAEYIAGIELFKGRAFSGRSKEMVRAWFARVPLGGPVAGARIALAMDMEGEIIATGVWGNEDFDTDATGRWSLLLNSLRTQSSPRLRDGEIAYGAVEASMKKIETGSKLDGQMARALVRTRRGMNRYSLVIGNLNMLLQRDELMPAEWFDPIIEDMLTLADDAVAFTPVIGPEGATMLSEKALEALEAFEEAKALAEDGETTVKDMADLVRRYTNAGGICRDCHDSRSGVGSNWRRLLRNKIFELEVPAGMM
ncbi:MAG: hypothetical protein ACYTG5_18570, partial [Planctomycetota bacterium]